MTLGRLLVSYVLAGVRRRQAFTIAAVLGLAQYFVLVYSPGQLRALVHAAPDLVRGVVVLIVWIAWMRSSRPLVWRLLLAPDVRMLRHLPIAANRWRTTHALHLVVLDVPLSGVALYGLLPTFARDRLAAVAWCLATVLAALAWRVGQCAGADGTWLRRNAQAIAGSLALAGVVSLASPWLAIAVAGGTAAWAWSRLSAAFAEPRVARAWRAWSWRSASPMSALARLHVAIAWQLERPFLVIAAAIQLGAMALGALACVRVGADDPGGATAAVRLFGCAAAGMATWSALRVERRIALDRWALDPFVSSRRLDVAARLVAAGAHAVPLVFAGVVMTAWVPPAFVPEILAMAIAATAWSAAVTLGVAVAAERIDRMHEPRILAQVLRLFLAGTATVLVGAPLLLALATAEALVACSRWPAAQRMRQRRARAIGEAERDG